MHIAVSNVVCIALHTGGEDLTNEQTLSVNIAVRGGATVVLGHSVGLSC